MDIKQNNVGTIAVIATILIATVAVFVFFFVRKEEAPTTQMSAESSQVGSRASQQQSDTMIPKKDQSTSHVVFTREVGGKTHVIYDGKDLGESSDAWPVISNGHVAFTRSVNDKDHIIYDGNDLGEGLRIVLSGDTIVFIREIQGKPHVIYNGEDFGIVDQGQDYQVAVSGKSVALERSINGKPHVFFNVLDQGEAVGGSVEVGESSVAFIRNVNGKEHVIYNGKDIGEGDRIEAVSDTHVYYSKLGVASETMFYRDQEFLGNGHTIDVTDDSEHYMLMGFKPGENSEFRVSYDGGQSGLMGGVMNTFMDGGHFAYYRDVNGEQHVIYDGNDLGVGDNISLSDNHIAFARKIGTEWHTIYDGKDIGIGSYPKILGDDMVVQRNVDGTAHLFLNDSDLGICGAQAQGTQTDDCWPDLSR